ncbi:cytochrome C assembly protein [Comamonadaceae bacterium OH2545_COT-014]|nr:cytochrome C assembly protein [Comamonadaceae bacterium OH2545_COT-014]
MILASPTPAAALLSAGAALAYAVPALAWRALGARHARAALLVAWILHAAVLAWALLGDGGPRFGFAQALSVTAWLVMTVYVVESQALPQLRTRWTLAGFGTAAVLLALLFPGQKLPPTHSALLPLHWALGIAAYGLFAAAVAHGWLMTRAEERFRQGADNASGVPLLTLERLMFRLVTAGFVALSATLLAGALFGEQLYGSLYTGWRWDHKRMFALLSWLTFAVLLWGRWRLGWRGKRAVRVLYAGAALLLLAYVGSRFVMEVLLGRAA